MKKIIYILAFMLIGFSAQSQAPSPGGTVAKRLYVSDIWGTDTAIIPYQVKKRINIHDTLYFPDGSKLFSANVVPDSNIFVTYNGLTYVLDSLGVSALDLQTVLNNGKTATFSGTMALTGDVTINGQLYDINYLETDGDALIDGNMIVSGNLTGINYLVTDGDIETPAGSFINAGGGLNVSENTVMYGTLTMMNNDIYSRDIVASGSITSSERLYAQTAIIDTIRGNLDSNKIFINGATFYSGGGDAGGAFTGTYSLAIGEQANKNHVKDSNQTYDVCTSLGFGAAENSHMSFSTSLGSGANKDAYTISTTSVGNDAGRNSKTWYDINSYGGNTNLGLNAGRDIDSASLNTAIGIGASAYNDCARRGTYVGAGTGGNGTLSGRHHENVTAVGSNAIATVSGKTVMGAYDYSSYGFENSLYQGGRRVNSFGKYGLLNTTPQFFTDVIQIGAYDAVSSNWTSAKVDSCVILANNTFSLYKKSIVFAPYHNMGLGKIVTSDSFKLDLLGNTRFTGTLNFTDKLMSIGGGSLSNPAITSTLDATTGIYFTSGQLNFATSGAFRWAISASSISATNNKGASLRSTQGSISVPQYSFVGDMDNGMASDTSDILKLSTNATLGLRIDASQNVSIPSTLTIGNATPNTSAALTIESTTGGVMFPSLTATQASALTPVARLVIFVSSTNGTFTSVGFWGYDGTAWTKF